VSGFNWYAHYEPTDMHIPCCHNALLSVAKLLLQKLSERESACCVSSVVPWSSRNLALISCRSSHVLPLFLLHLFIRWWPVADPRAQDVEQLQVLQAQLVCSFCSFCCSMFCWWFMQLAFNGFCVLLLSWSSVRDLLQLMDPGFGAWSSIPQLLLRQLKYPAHHACMDPKL
jgi:hypothetical protein